MKQKIVHSFSKNRFVQKLLSEIYNRRKQKISGQNNQVISDRKCWSNVKYDIEGNNNIIEVKPGRAFADITIFIRGNNHKLIIGENCICRGITFWLEGDNCEINIGRESRIATSTFSALEHNKKILVGEDCMISYDVEIKTGDSHCIMNNDTRKRVNFDQDIILENHVWIGAHVVVMKGVKIGHNSVIATKAVVTKDVPPHSIVAGIPAKVVKENIDWSREQIYDQDEESNE